MMLKSNEIKERFNDFDSKVVKFFLIIKIKKSSAFAKDKKGSCYLLWGSK